MLFQLYFKESYLVGIALTHLKLVYIFKPEVMSLVPILSSHVW